MAGTVAPTDGALRGGRWPASAKGPGSAAPPGPLGFQRCENRGHCGPQVTGPHQAPRVPCAPRPPWAGRGIRCPRCPFPIGRTPGVSTEPGRDNLGQGHRGARIKALDKPSGWRGARGRGQRLLGVHGGRWGPSYDPPGLRLGSAITPEAWRCPAQGLSHGSQGNSMQTHGTRELAAQATWERGRGVCSLPSDLPGII